jgi:hypothetical protein
METVPSPAKCKEKPQQAFQFSFNDWIKPPSTWASPSADIPLTYARHTADQCGDYVAVFGMVVIAGLYEISALENQR